MRYYEPTDNLPFEPWFETDAPDQHSELFGIGQNCQFNLLAPTSDGVGPYHINTHKIFFRPPAGKTPAQLTADLHSQFPRIFTPNNIAKVVLASCRHSGHPTFKFTADTPGPDLHDDWVHVEWHQSSFLAKTLERKWSERWEAAAQVGAGGLRAFPLGLIPTAFGQISLRINRRHFLAGRRSWHVGQASNGLYFLETAAFERYSHRAFQLAESIVGIPAQIVQIWATLLENFVRHIGATVVANPPPGYRQYRHVYWNRAQQSNAGQLRNTAWFRALAGRHVGL